MKNEGVPMKDEGVPMLDDWVPVLGYGIPMLDKIEVVDEMSITLSIKR